MKGRIGVLLGLIASLLLSGCGGSKVSVGNNPPPDPIPEQGAPQLPVPPEPPPAAPTPPRAVNYKSLRLGLGICLDDSRKSNTEWNLIAAGGFNLVRFDLRWADVERVPGDYRFKTQAQDYDGLVSEAKRRNIRVMFILNYGNPLYDEGYAPNTDAGRTAFAKFAHAAAEHFRGQDILWEIWNEPNEPEFWSMSPANGDTVEESYAKLVVAVSEQIRQADPTGMVVAGAIGSFAQNVGHSLVREMAEFGALARIDAISVHPYRSTDPETVSADYVQLRTLLQSLGQPLLPILNSEVGRSTGMPVSGSRITEQQQASALVRTALADWNSGVPLTTWFCWTDGPNPDGFMDSYGVKRYATLQTKPAYDAAKTLMTMIAAATLLDTPNFSLPTTIKALKFLTPRGITLVFWNTSPGNHVALINVPQGDWTVFSMNGDLVSTHKTATTISLSITGQPVYLAEGLRLGPSETHLP